MRRGAIVLAAVIVSGCSGRDLYRCTSSEQCILDGAAGVCEPSGFCSFPGPSCPGRQYEPNAGDGLGGTCVDIDAAVAPCGGAGQACCDGEPRCGDGAFCGSDGVCRACAADVSFGRHHTCVLDHGGGVWCAGDNDEGQIGIGLAGPDVKTWTRARDASNTPLAEVTAIGVGGEHSCALRAGGAVWCWGENNDGEVGNNTTVQAPAAVAVLKSDGSPLTGIAQVRGGNEHTCAIDGEGAVWCWGFNAQGQLGDGTTTPRSHAAQVRVAPGGAPFVGAVELMLGRHSCARTASNEVWCWGANESGQLGDGGTTHRLNPVLVGASTPVGVGNTPHTCRVNADTTVSCVGAVWRGRLGNATVNQDGGSPAFTATPVQVLSARGGPALTGVSKVVAGGVSCALLHDGTVACWGDSIHGQTGSGAGSPVPRPVLRAPRTPLTGVDRLIAGYAHACAHVDGSGFWCWGRNVDGELGDGTTTDRGLPSPLTFACP